MIDFFLPSITEGIVLMHKVYFFVHYQSELANTINYFDQSQNFGVFYYICINSPFILYKTYLQLLYRIIYNNANRKYCRFFYLALKTSDLQPQVLCCYLKNKISCFIFMETKTFCVQIINFSGEYIDPHFAKRVFQTYETGKYYFSINLDIEI